MWENSSKRAGRKKAGKTVIFGDTFESKLADLQNYHAKYWHLNLNLNQTHPQGRKTSTLCWAQVHRCPGIKRLHRRVEPYRLTRKWHCMFSLLGLLVLRNKTLHCSSKPALRHIHAKINWHQLFRYFFFPYSTLTQQWSSKDLYFNSHIYYVWYYKYLKQIFIRKNVCTFSCEPSPPQSSGKILNHCLPSHWLTYFIDTDKAYR